VKLQRLIASAMLILVEHCRARRRSSQHVSGGLSLTKTLEVWRYSVPAIVLFSLLAAFSLPSTAQMPACTPCAGIRVEEPADLEESLLAEPRLEEGSRLYVAWTAELDGSASAEGFARVRAVGAIPWLTVVFRTPTPVRQNLAALQVELEELALLARAASDEAHFHITWDLAGEAPDAEDLAFLIKRASVAVTGARSEALVFIGPLPTEERFLRQLYGEEIAAYVDGVTLSPITLSPSALSPSTPTPGTDLEATIDLLQSLDAGKPVVLDSLPWPDETSRILASAARSAAAGAAITLFRSDEPETVDLVPLKMLAREFQGDVSYDPYTTVAEASNAWVFARGEDLGLRVIAEVQTGSQITLVVSDPQLRDPVEVDLTTGETEPIARPQRGARGLYLTVRPTRPIALLRIERMTAEELGGGEERLEIAGSRQMPVEEILRRLQAFEDDQKRRVTHYQARNILHLRFQSGPAGIEAAYEGPFFYDRETGFDWVWENFYVGGVKWRSKRMPELPLITPEKAAVLPLEITLSKEYRYRLRGTATVSGRDCWVIDFRPLEATPGRNLHQGTVWVDRLVYARVRTRAVQLALEGEVLSNEETVTFGPVDENGQPAPWSRESYILPLRIVGQQLLSVLNATVPLETETELSQIRINADDFAANREAAWASEATMVRDTDKGMRYLRRDENGERFVEMEVDSSRVFLVGGVFWDESLDYPIPLVGVNFLSLDFKHTGNQVNLFAAGPLITANLAEPRLFGSRWDAGVNFFGFFIDTTDELYRNGREVETEAIDSSNSSASFFLGHPIGNFAKLDLAYSLRRNTYSRADDTAEDFVVPVDTTTHTLSAELRYIRGGYRAVVEGSRHSRSDWDFWGLPGNTDFDPDQKDYNRFRASFAKTWWFKKFRNFGIELEYLGGSNLDRFSSYDFGIFGDATVAGYQSGLVRADTAKALHVEYGVNIGDVIRFGVEGDSVLATNEMTGLDDELLAGIGIEGSLTLPGQLLTNFEVGIAVAGPGEGNVAARIVFLRLFPRKANRKKK